MNRERERGKEFCQRAGLSRSAADDVDGLGVGAGPLEEAAVATDDLVHAVARELEKALTRVDDRVVGQRGVRDGEVLLRRLQRHHEPKVGLHELLRRRHGRAGRAVRAVDAFFE